MGPFAAVNGGPALEGGSRTVQTAVRGEDVPPYLSVAMPAYNEEAILERNATALGRALDALGQSWELVIVDDGSRDRTPAIAAALSAADPRVRVHRHPRNLGVGQAIVTGICAARGEWFIMVPADLALNLDQLSRYFAATADADIVLGVCPDRSDYTPYRTLLSRTNVWLIQTLFRLPYHQYNYVNLYRTALVQAHPPRYVDSAFLYAEIVVRAAAARARVVEVPIDYVPRAGGRATGGDPSLVLRTGRDMLAFWLRYSLAGGAAHLAAGLARRRGPQPSPRPRR
jgi:glycosyltransferase involved in cell wall biosynthesis